MCLKVSLTLVQATNTACSLQDFLLSRSDVPESVLNSCAVVGDYLERSFMSGSVQRKITVQNIVYRYSVKFDLLKNYRKPLAITVYHYFVYIYPNFPLI